MRGVLASHASISSLDCAPRLLRRSKRVELWWGLLGADLQTTWKIPGAPNLKHLEPLRTTQESVPKISGEFSWTFAFSRHSCSGDSESQSFSTHGQELLEDRVLPIQLFLAEQTPFPLQGELSTMDSNIFPSLVPFWSNWSELAKRKRFGDSLEQRRNVVRVSDLFFKELRGTKGSCDFFIPTGSPLLRDSRSLDRSSLRLGSSPISQYVKRSPFPFIETRPRSIRRKPPRSSRRRFVSLLQWIFRAAGEKKILLLFFENYNFFFSNLNLLNLRAPEDSIRLAVLTVSPKRQ